MKISRMDLRNISQKALLEIVTENLNAVTVAMFSKELIVNFYYDTPPSEDEIQLSQIFSKKMSLELNDFVIKMFHVVLKSQKLIPLKKEDQWIFYRKKERSLYLLKIKTFFNEINLSSIKSSSLYGLLGCVTTNLRAVSIELFNEEFILNFYYDKKLEGMEDSYEWCYAQNAFGNIIFSFRKITGKINRFIIAEPTKLALEGGSFWVYKRYEKNDNPLKLE